MKSSSNQLHQVISVCLLILLSLTNCSPPEAEIPEHLKELENLTVVQPYDESTSSIEFTRAAVIDDANATKTWFKDISTGGFPFGGADWFAGLEIDGSGRIYVGHRLEKIIQVFDSTGRYLVNVGGEGNGPGEFKGITEIRIQSNQLYAFDFLQFRTTFFSLDSLKVDEVKDAYLSRAPDVEELTGWLYNGNKLIDDERFLVRYMDEYANANVGTPKYNLDKPRPGRYYIVNREGKVVSEMLFELKDQKKNYC